MLIQKRGKICQDKLISFVIGRWSAIKGYVGSNLPPIKRYFKFFMVIGFWPRIISVIYGNQCKNKIWLMFSNFMWVKMFFLQNRFVFMMADLGISSHSTYFPRSGQILRRCKNVQYSLYLPISWLRLCDAKT